MNFKSNYVIMNQIQYQIELVRKHGFKDIKMPNYKGCTYIIVGIYEKKVYLSSTEDIKDKSFALMKNGYNDLSFLSEYEVKDQNKVLLQCDKINVKATKGYGKFYAIDGIWLAFTYYTTNKTRMVINKNLFGKYDKSLLRDLTIQKILED